MRDLTEGDLRKATWDWALGEVLGAYKGETIRAFCADLDNDQIPGVAQRCNLSEGWVEYIETEDGTMAGKPRRDGQDRIVVKRMNYTGKVVVCSLKGEKLVTLPPQEAESLATTRC